MEGLNKYLYCLILLSLILQLQGQSAGGTCSSPCQFVPGPPGRDGRDGAPGSPGAPGMFSYSDYLRLKEELRTELLQELRGNHSGCPVRPTPTPSPSMYISRTPMPSPQPTGQPGPCMLGLSEYNPASSCAEILRCNPNATSRDYWIQTRYGINSFYCHMEEDKCGVRGVMRVVNIDMTDPNGTCPYSLTQYTLDNGKRICGPTNPTNMSDDMVFQFCNSAYFSTRQYPYSMVCGRAVGYQYHQPCAFASSNPEIPQVQGIDGAYVSGLSITRGAPGNRTHIWTYAAGHLEANYTHGCNCPCDQTPGIPAPGFVGDDYYCESAVAYTPPDPPRWYTNNTLWDNENCHGASDCCDTPEAPWFVKVLDSVAYDSVELRWCTGAGVVWDRVGIQEAEIYVY